MGLERLLSAISFRVLMAVTTPIYVGCDATSEPVALGCKTDNDCKGERVCFEGNCRNKNELNSANNPSISDSSTASDSSSLPETNSNPNLCCGSIIYASGGHLYKFDLKTFSEVGFPDIPYRSFRKSHDKNKIIFTHGESSCCQLSEQPLARITDLEGNILTTVLYHPVNLNQVTSGFHSPGDCQLTSNNNELLAVLGELSENSAQLYRVGFDGHLDQMTFQSQDIESVTSYVITPNDFIYFSALTMGDEKPQLWKSNLQNFNPVPVSLSKQTYLGEMDWLDSKQKLLAGRFGGEIYLIDPSSGEINKLDIHVLYSSGSFEKTVFISPDETKFIYNHQSANHLYDLITKEDFPINKENFPCKKYRCFEALQGVWVP